MGYARGKLIEETRTLPRDRHRDKPRSIGKVVADFLESLEKLVTKFGGAFQSPTQINQRRRGQRASADFKVSGPQALTSLLDVEDSNSKAGNRSGNFLRKKIEIIPNPVNLTHCP